MENLENKQPEFSNDPGKDLRIENEILKLKLQAEYGAVGGTSGDCPPEIEYQFLQNVIAIEEAWRNVKFITVYEFIGEPAFKKLDELTADEVENELDRLLEIMQKNHIHLHFDNEYPVELMYRFITEELFEEETEDMMLPGWEKTFIYEEFHPQEES